MVAPDCSTPLGQVGAPCTGDSLVDAFGLCAGTDTEIAYLWPPRREG
jgi:hypothetical protein